MSRAVKIFTLLIAFVCLTNGSVIINSESDHCYSDDEHPYLLYGTKTAYEIEHGIIRNATLPNCKPIQIWMLVRHGTRNPDKGKIKSMINNLPELRNRIVRNHEKDGNVSLCEKDIEWLKSWKVDRDLDTHKKKYLTKQGERDMWTLGNRFKDYFPGLLQPQPGDVLNDKYKFRSTDKQRTVASMEFFINGIFGNLSIDNEEVVPGSRDTLLKVYKTCKPWLANQDTPTLDAGNAFKNGRQFNQLINDVSRRLGFSNNLSFDDVWLMYTACSFESAWYVNERKSPWCAVFTKDELKVFEYYEDLSDYYYDGYGQNLNIAVGCPPLKDMFDRFTRLENEEVAKEPRGVFYFAHSTAIGLLFTAMQIARDPLPLKASNFANMENREWSTSRLLPFAANLAAVFYKCDSSNKVRFYLNEKPLDYEGCETNVCDWEYLKKKLGPTAFNCNTNFCTSSTCNSG